MLLCKIMPCSCAWLLDDSNDDNDDKRGQTVIIDDIDGSDDGNNKDFTDEDDEVTLAMTKWITNEFVCEIGQI